MLLSSGKPWCRELTYPEPRDILRLTLLVLACSAALTALVWGIDKAFASLLLPKMVCRFGEGALKVLSQMPAPPPPPTVAEIWTDQLASWSREYWTLLV